MKSSQWCFGVSMNSHKMFQKKGGNVQGGSRQMSPKRKKMEDDGYSWIY